MVKQAENLKESACMENWRGELLGSVVSRLKDCFLELNAWENEWKLEEQRGLI